MTYEEIEKRALSRGIPEYMIGGLQRYLVDGINPGSFLSSVICNNLFEAAACADHLNAQKLMNYCMFFYNDVPSACFGSTEKFNAWIKEERK